MLLEEILSLAASVLEGIEWGPLIGSFLGLLIPGLITVLGSYYIYKKRRGDKKRALQSALKTEVQQMQSLENLSEELENLSTPPPAKPIPSSKLPPSGVFPTDLYEGNVQSLGLLDDGVQDDIVEFYSGVLNQKALIQGIRGEEAIPEADHKDLYETVPELVDQRNQLLSRLGDDP